MEGEEYKEREGEGARRQGDGEDEKKRDEKMGKRMERGN